MFAQEFIGTSARICIIESGVMNLDPKYQTLNEIECVNLPVAPNSRARGFGGTTKVWAGRWREHDEIDFEKRDWVPNSGWPIGKNDLTPYYQRAAKTLNIHDTFHKTSGINSKKLQPIFFNLLETKYWTLASFLKRA